MEFKIKETRVEYNVTQKELSELLEIPLRTIENWESGKRSPSPWVVKLIIDSLKHQPHNEHGIITKTKGYYTIDQITELLLPLTFKYEISKFILFGSYSNGKQDEQSDIDLVVDGNLEGLVFFGLLEDVTNLFKKSVDLIHITQIDNNSDTYNQVMEGIVLYERKR